MVRAPFSLAAEEQWFEEITANQGKTVYHFVICRLSDGEPIGTAGLHDLDYVNGNAEFGISLGEKGEWNKGYGTDALHVLCDFGFGELRFERIELQVYERMPAHAAPTKRPGSRSRGRCGTALRRGAVRGRPDHVAPPRGVGGAVPPSQLGAERARLTGLVQEAARCSSSAAIR